MLLRTNSVAIEFERGSETSGTGYGREQPRAGERQISEFAG